MKSTVTLWGTHMYHLSRSTFAVIVTCSVQYMHVHVLCIILKPYKYLVKVVKVENVLHLV